ncbi:MAG: tetratricopeptide repeat protein [Betaproteobacteria bacterium]|nr:tetratricopeptide repeat protein [Betaproteobacteria bacterium]
MVDHASAIDFSIPYNVHYDFDRDLRELPIDRAAMERGVAWLGRQITNLGGDLHAVARLSGMHGVYSRILGHLEQAEASLRSAVDLSRSVLDTRLVFINELRLAHVHQWQGRFDLSTPMFEELLLRAEKDRHLGLLLDFAMQHAGKNAFDQGKYAEALSHFAGALALRRLKNDARLLQSTETAIAVTRSRIEALPATPRAA